MSSDLRYFTLYSRLWGAVSHRIRNSLNVISNELAFLDGQSPSDDLTRARARCREIQNLLKSITLGELSGSSHECRLPALCNGIPIRGEVPDLAIHAPPMLLQRAFEELARVAARFETALHAVSSTPQEILLSLKGRHENLSHHTVESTSLSELCIERLGLDDPSSVLFDLLWWTLQGTIDVAVKDGTVHLRLAIPVRFECSP